MDEIKIFNNIIKITRGDMTVKVKIGYYEQHIILERGETTKIIPISPFDTDKDLNVIADRIFKNFDTLINSELIKENTYEYVCSTFLANRMTEALIEGSKDVKTALKEYKKRLENYEEKEKASRRINEIMNTISVEMAHKQMNNNQVWLFRMGDKYLLFISDGNEGKLKMCGDITSLIKLWDEEDLGYANRYREPSKEVLKDVTYQLPLIKAIVLTEGKEHVQVLENCVAEAKIKNM